MKAMRKKTQASQDLDIILQGMQLFRTIVQSIELEQGRGKSMNQLQKVY
jgi:hypothetical protein